MENKGILLPVASLPGHHGIGDFGDSAYSFIRWLEQKGFKYWQILPINPLGPGWSPYMTTCSEAIETRYICLDYLKKEGMLDEVKPYRDNASKINYVGVGKYKEKYLHRAFRHWIKNHPDGLKGFIKKQPWVVKYAIFNVFYQINNGAGWNTWPDDQKFYLENHKVNEYPKQYKNKIEYLIFCQMIAYKQWFKIRNYAHKHGIKIIGDIPFYVGYTSVDCWANKDVFDFDENYNPKTVAGCPPDGFSEDGQYWGNPCFNFNKMKENDYEFYVNRLGAVGQICDIIRLDHFRAFDAYYAIPYGRSDARVGEWIDGPSYGLFNAFFKKYPNTEIIAEDLGYMNDRVYKLRDDFNLPGMYILQFKMFEPKYEDTSNLIVYTGTHDNDTIKQWYLNMSQDSRNYVINKIGGDVNKNFLKQFMNYVWKVPSRMTIIPLQDYLLLDNRARLNWPGTFGSPNWEWKLKKLPLNK